MEICKNKIKEENIKYIKNNSCIYPRLNFGMFKSIIPKNLYQYLIDISDEALSKKENDMKNKLVGRIYKGSQVSISNIINLEFQKYIVMCCEEYANLIASGSDLKPKNFSNLNLESIWVVSQFANDYNPLHAHSGKISGIIYLKVPPQINNPQKEIEYIKDAEAERKNYLVDGRIGFLLQYVDLESGHVKPFQKVIEPVEGTMYLFPSSIQHVVYPYEGPGERRSVAFNLI